jgi:hypothetical protein
MLNDGTSREVVVAALGEQNGIVGQFLTLLLKEEDRQSDERKKDEGITITDTACKP